MIPKEFVLYFHNHALKFINSQPKLNKKNAKWVEFVQNFIFVIKHTSGKSNKVHDHLSRVNLSLHVIKVSTFGFQNLVNMYKKYVYFKHIYANCENPISHNKSKWEYMIQ